MDGIGLVLAGGGGRGAYQIGVWKYLQEQGLDRYVRGVSGTSVGGLNAALFAAGDYETAEKVWLNISPDKLLSPKKITFADVARWAAVIGVPIARVNGLFGLATSGLIGNVAKALFDLQAFRNSRYALSREGLCELMDKGLNFDALRNSQIPCYVTCLRIPDFKPERFDLRAYSTYDIRSILLATSAIPFVYDAVEFQKKLYIDGGVELAGGDNIPIQPLYDMGLEYIFVLHLSGDETINKSKYPGAKIIEIVPQENLGGLFDGTLDFSPQGAQRRLDQGYKDAKRVMEPLKNQLCLAVQQERKLNNAMLRQQNFESSYHDKYEALKAIKQGQASDGFDQLLDKLGGKG